MRRQKSPVYVLYIHFTLIRKRKRGKRKEKLTSLGFVRAVLSMVPFTMCEGRVCSDDMELFCWFPFSLLLLPPPFICPFFGFFLCFLYFTLLKKEFQYVNNYKITFKNLLSLSLASTTSKSIDVFSIDNVKIIIINA